MAKKYEGYVILTGHPGMTFIEPRNEPRIAELLRQEKTGELPRKPGMSRPRAVAEISEDMLYDLVENEDGDVSKEFKDSVKVAEADEFGRVFIPAAEHIKAKKILERLRRSKIKAKLDPMGYMLEDETPKGPAAERHVGGRGRKKVNNPLEPSLD